MTGTLCPAWRLCPGPGASHSWSLTRGSQSWSGSLSPRAPEVGGLRNRKGHGRAWRSRSMDSRRWTQCWWTSRGQGGHGQWDDGLWEARGRGLGPSSARWVCWSQQGPIRAAGGVGGRGRDCLTASLGPQHHGSGFCQPNQGLGWMEPGLPREAALSPRGSTCCHSAHWQAVLTPQLPWDQHLELTTSHEPDLRGCFCFMKAVWAEGCRTRSVTPSGVQHGGGVIAAGPERKHGAQLALLCGDSAQGRARAGAPGTGAPEAGQPSGGGRVFRDQQGAPGLRGRPAQSGPILPSCLVPHPPD